MGISIKRHLTELLIGIIEVIKALIVIAAIGAGSLVLAAIWLAIIQAFQALK